MGHEAEYRKIEEMAPGEYDTAGNRQASAKPAMGREQKNALFCAELKAVHDAASMERAFARLWRHTSGCIVPKSRRFREWADTHALSHEEPGGGTAGRRQLGSSATRITDPIPQCGQRWTSSFSVMASFI